MALAEPIIRSVQSGKPTIDGKGRNDLADNVLVTLSNIEPTHEGADLVWEFEDRPYGSTALFSSATATSPTFTPSAGIYGDYVVALTARIGGRVSRTVKIFSVPMPLTGLRRISWGEENEYDGDGNTRGHAQATDAIIDTVEDHEERIADVEAGGGVIAALDSRVDVLEAVTGKVLANALDTTAELLEDSLTVTGSGLVKSTTNTGGNRRVNIASAAYAGADTAALPAATSFVGDVSGLYSATSVDKVKGKTVGTLTDQQVVWLNGTTLETKTRAGIDTTAIHSGDAAGGSLGGTYPTSVTVAKINETGGPTALTIGAIADGSFARRVGSTLIGAIPATFIKYALFLLNADKNLANGGIVDFDQAPGQDESDGFTVGGTGIITPPAANFLVVCGLRADGMTTAAQDFWIKVDAAGGTPATTVGTRGLAHPTNLASTNSALPFSVAVHTFDGTKTCAIVQGTTTNGTWELDSCFLLFLQIGTAT